MTNPFESAVDDAYNPFALNENNVQQSNVYNNDTVKELPPSHNIAYNTVTGPQSKEPTVFKDPITGLNVSESELKAREEALARRELVINNREQEIETARASGTLNELNPRPNNYPLYLKWYKYYPDEDLPTDAQQLVSRFMWLTYAGGFLLIINFVFSLFCLAPGPAKTILSPSTTVFYAIIYMIVVFPLSVELCFMPLYNSLKDGKGLKYFGTLITYGIYFAFFVYICVGLGDWGSIGWITTINLFGAESQSWVGVLGLIFSIASTVFCCFLGWEWWQSFKYYKNNDIQRKAFSEAAIIAGNYAANNKDKIVETVQKHPELAGEVVTMAAPRTA